MRAAVSAATGLAAGMGRRPEDASHPEYQFRAIPNSSLDALLDGIVSVARTFATLLTSGF
jgi:hypothetical protein